MLVVSFALAVFAARGLSREQGQPLEFGTISDLVPWCAALIAVPTLVFGLLRVLYLLPPPVKKSSRMD